MLFDKFIIDNSSPTNRSQKGPKYTLNPTWTSYCYRKDVKHIKPEQCLDVAFQKVAKLLIGKITLLQGNIFTLSEKLDGRLEDKIPCGKTIKNWLKMRHPKTVLSSHISDYCSFCDRIETEIGKLKHSIMFATGNQVLGKIVWFTSTNSNNAHTQNIFTYT